MDHKTTQVKSFLFRGLLPFQAKSLLPSLFAGILLAAVAIPIDMGYAKLAGMPVVTGLYALFLPAIAFALFGASKQLVVGADSATAAISATAILALAVAGSSEYQSYTALLALLVGFLLLICRLFRLGFIANFLSRTVLVGFLVGIGVQVALGQLPDLLGISASGNAIEKTISVFQNLSSVNRYAFLIAVCSLIVILVPKFFDHKLPVLKKIPWALIVMIGTILAGHFLHLSALGVPSIGSVQGGLPNFSMPAFSFSAILALLGSAISIAVIIITQSAATSSAFAVKHQQETYPNTDIMGLAAANIVSGFFGGFVVNGSPTKTEVADSAGSRSQLTNLVMAIVVVLILLFFTKPLQYLPNAALAAVVFSTGVSLIDVTSMKNIFVKKKDEFLLALATAAVVVGIGAVQGIVFAMILSLIDHLHRIDNPQNAILVLNQAEKTYDWQPVQAGLFVHPGIIVYRFTSDLYYANMHLFAAQIKLLSEQTPAPKKIVLDFSAIADVDFSGGEILKETFHQLQEKNILLSIVLIQDHAYAQLKTYGFLDLLDKDAVYPTIPSVIKAAKKDFPDITLL